jgi:hypothetical protein
VSTKLLDGNFSAAYGFAGKAANFANFVRYDTVTLSVNSEVTASGSTFAGALGLADLAYDNLTDADFLTAKQLNAETLALAIACIFTCTACFDV